MGKLLTKNLKFYKTEVGLLEIRQHAKFCETEVELSKKMGLSVKTLQKYKREHPEILEATKYTLQQEENQIFENLLKLSKGFFYEEKKKTVEKFGEAKKEKFEVFEKYSKPDKESARIALDLNSGKKEKPKSKEKKSEETEEKQGILSSLKIV
jgi:hypothetical protein